MNVEFTRLLDEHKALVFKVANAYGSASDRDDLAQEIVMQLWRAFPRYDRQRRFSTWAYRIALNVALSFQRRETRRTRRVVAEPALLETRAVETSSDDDVAELHELVGRFNELDRALMLLYLDEYDHVEIADILGLSVTNVGTKISRLKERLRHYVASERKKENNP